MGKCLLVAVNELIRLFVVLLFVFSIPLAHSQEANERLFELSGALPDIEPDVERRDVSIPRIDSEIVEFGAYVGSLSVEDFGSHLSYGGKIAVHATQAVFLEVNGGMSQVNDNVFRRLGLPLFGEQGVRNLEYYNVMLGWNVLPGELYLGELRTLSSVAYLLAGAGSLRFGNKDYFNISLGMGIRLMPLDWLSLRIEVIGSEYESDIFGFDKTSHNFESSAGINIFF